MAGRGRREKRADGLIKRLWACGCSCAVPTPRIAGGKQVVAGKRWDELWNRGGETSGRDWAATVA